MNKTNNHLVSLLDDLKKKSSEQKVGIWKSVAKTLEGPARKARTVNLYKIDQYIKDQETAVIPGKVLGTGTISKNVTVAAFAFSTQAREKINKTGKAITISELMNTNPKGSKVRIIG